MKLWSLVTNRHFFFIDDQLGRSCSAPGWYPRWFSFWDWGHAWRKNHTPKRTIWGWNYQSSSWHPNIAPEKINEDNKNSEKNESESSIPSALIVFKRKWSVYGICRDCFLDEISIDSLSIKQSKKSEVQLASLIWMKTCKRLFTGISRSEGSSPPQPTSCWNTCFLKTTRNI